MSEVLIWLAMCLLPSLLIVAWIKADEWLGGRDDESPSERKHRLDAEAARPDYEANVIAFDRMGVRR